MESVWEEMQLPGQKNRNGMAQNVPFQTVWQDRFGIDIRKNVSVSWVAKSAPVQKEPIGMEKSVSPARGGKKWNESISMCTCPGGHIWKVSKCVESSSEAKNVRTCDVLSSHFNLEGRSFA